MSLKKELLVFFIPVITITHQSIVGVTYMDHFDFEQRYSDVNECDPLYWHPLHLPHKCMHMFQDLIRSKIASVFDAPVRVVKERESVVYERPRKHHNYEIDPYAIQPSDFNIDFATSGNFLSDKYIKSLPPYERMLALLTRDVYNRPTAPVVGMMPHVGPVAVYNQPVSKQSEIMMKTIAKSYADANKKKHGKSKGYMRIYKQGADGKIIKERDDFSDDEKNS